MKLSLKQAKLTGILFFILLYAAFYVYKTTKYDLFYYIHDIFSIMIASCGWMHGHPLWWDNRYGFTPSIHFSFTAPLLSPFIIFGGGKGLFIFHCLAYFLAFYFVIRTAADKISFNIKLAVLAVFLFGPYAFWLFDDITYGWHIELALLPLGVFFACALISQKKWLIVLCSALLVFTKEDGIVMACCIHLLYLLSKNQDAKTNWKKIFLVTAGWITVFLIALFVIKYFRNFEETRLEAALREFHEDTKYFNSSYFTKITWQFAVMFLPLAGFCYYILNRVDFIKLLLLTLPMIVTGVISGLWYSGDVRLSVTWAPRFVEIMGVMLAGTVVLLNYQAGENFPNKKTVPAVAIIATFILQGLALIAAKDYNIFEEIKKVAQKVLPENITASDAGIIKCISEKTPHDFNVAVPYEYFSKFDRNDFTWFGYYDYAPQKNPDLVILDDSLKFTEYKFDYDQYQSEKKGKFYVLVKKDKMLLSKDCN